MSSAPGAKLHVTFNRSIAFTLRQALLLQGLSDPVVGFCDDLSFGPLDVAPQARADWIAEVVGYDFDDVVVEAEAFWCNVLASDLPLVAWVNLHNSLEYCGLLEFLWRIDDRPVHLIDATNVAFADHQGRMWTPRSLGVVSAGQFVRANLLDRRRLMSPSEIEGHREIWRRLRAENAPLRIVTPSGLASAPIDHFDGWLTKHATGEWIKGALLVGHALGDSWQNAQSAHVSDMWLWGRVQALAESGVLDLEGDPTTMQGARVRLPPANR